jgi:AraC-like DNA-binding protein
MIHLPIHNQDSSANICLRGELSRAAQAESPRSPSRGALAEVVDLSSADATNRAQSRAVRRVEASVRYMMEHLNQPLKVSTLSALAGVSNSSFFLLFKNVTGHTPLAFFIRARMCRAGDLLAGTTLQIKEVAASLGYDDQFYFSRLFKSVHGVAPREYRARQQQVANRSVQQATVDQPSAEPSLVSAHPTRVPETYTLSLHNHCGGPQSKPNQTCLVHS